jgi:hypothetical protein
MIRQETIDGSKYEIGETRDDALALLKRARVFAVAVPFGYLATGYDHVEGWSFCTIPRKHAQRFLANLKPCDRIRSSFRDFGKDAGGAWLHLGSPYIFDKSRRDEPKAPAVSDGVAA